MSKKIERLTTLYEKDKNGGLNVFDSPSKSPFTNNVKLFSGSGGLLSTTNDYLIFCQMLLNGGTFNNQRIIKNSTLNLMLEDHSNELKYSGLVFGKNKGCFEKKKAQISGCRENKTNFCSKH